MNATPKLKIDERSLHLFAVQLLRLSAAPGVVFFHTPNEGARSPRTGAFQKRIGMRAGVADLVLILPPRGLFAAIELKSTDGRLTPEQRRFRDDVEAAGGAFAVCNSPDQVSEILHKWGAVK